MRKMKQRFLVILLLTTILCLTLKAQNYTRLPYFMGFENVEQTEMNRWVINPGTFARINNGKYVGIFDNWLRGNELSREGDYALYITSVSFEEFWGKAMFSRLPGVQFAYRDLLLPAGKFVLSFDRLCAGNDKIQCGYGTCDNTVNLTAYEKPSQIPPSLKFTRLTGNTKNWETQTDTLYSDGINPVRLFFVWISSIEKTEDWFYRTNIKDLSFVIDNIQIYDPDKGSIEDLQVTLNSDCNQVLCTWKGKAASYELYYCRQEENKWHAVKDILPIQRLENGSDSAMTLIYGLKEGIYHFKVRGFNISTDTRDTTAWAFCFRKNILCQGDRCINYLDLYAPGVKCTYGNMYEDISNIYGVSTPKYSRHGNKAYSHTGIIDYGEKSVDSRHTTVWDTTATDPNTQGKLRCVPPGAKVSVRIGNSEVGADAESVSYPFYVTEDNSILLMQYAIVVEDPSHGNDYNPRFELTINRPNGTLVNEQCGKYNYVANVKSETDGWKVGKTYQQSDGRNVRTVNILYKEWSLVGINLSDYVGETVQIRLTTYDCFALAHFGYAYFTLDCTSPVVSNNACGIDSESPLSLIAPAGFSYKWYNEKNQLVGTEQQFTPSDTLTYRCVLSSKDNPNCSFELFGKSKKQIPHAEFEMQQITKDCKNQVRLRNKSHIIYQHADGSREITDEHCKSYLWTTWNDSDFIRTSNDTNPVFEYPQYGGNYYISLTASINDKCEDIKKDSLFFPKLETATRQLDTTLCYGETFYWKDKDTTITTNGTYRLALKNIHNCDSIIICNVRFTTENVTLLPDTTIPFGDTYCIGDTCYDTEQGSGLFTRVLPSSAQCDSVIKQYIRVIPLICPHVNIVQTTDNKRFTLQINETEYDYYTINNTLNGELDNIPPGEHNLTFYKDTLGNLYHFNTHITIIDTALCFNQPFYLETENATIRTEGLYTKHLRSEQGCDTAITGYIVHFLPENIVNLTDTALICPDDSFCIDNTCYNGKNGSGLFTRVLTSQKNCDSIINQYVRVLPPIHPMVNVTQIINEDRQVVSFDLGGSGYDYYSINGVFNGNLSDLPPDRYTLTFYKDTLGTLCQSDTTITTQGLCLKADLLPQEICELEKAVVKFPYIIREGYAKYYSLIFSPKATEQGFVNIDHHRLSTFRDNKIKIDIPEKAQVGIYDVQIILHDHSMLTSCPDVVFDTTFLVTYSGSVLFVAWGDVISLKNEQYAGYSPFTFTEYQWILDDQPIPGATLSYYWEPEGLQRTGKYQLWLKQPDQQTFITCPHYPALHEVYHDTPQTDKPTINISQKEKDIQIDIAEETQLVLCDITGRILISQQLPAGKHRIRTPQQPGLYVLQCHSASDHKHLNLMIP